MTEAGPEVPRDTSPTWELEMLISGGVVFSLLQLPPLVDDIVTRWQPHATTAFQVVLIMGYIYVKAALYTLIGAFIVHLGARAYWVGLMGLHSVFPNGIKWERTQLGPIAQEVYRKRMPGLPTLISSIDNFASIIFSFAFLVVLVFLVSMPLVAGLGGVAYLVSRVFGAGAFRTAFFALATLLAVVPVSVALYDVKRGRLHDPSTRTGRVLRKLTRVFYTTQMVGLVGPTLFTIGTNGRRKTTYAVFYLVFLGAMAVAIVEFTVRNGIFALSGAEFFSTRSDEHSLDYASYESQWPPDYVNRAVPSIQTDVIKDPYVRLFVPYQPSRHNFGIAKQCPGVAPLQKRGLRVATAGPTGAAADSASARVLACVAALHPVKINGVPITDVRYRFATHPRTGVDGVVAYLPVEGLPRGENTLSVLPPPRSPRSKNTRPLVPYLIPFWL